MTHKILLGTSGWSYREWIGPFYNDAAGMLRHYTSIFRTAEIDSTFYAFPSRGLVMGWKMHTPADFTFTAKLPRLITHEKKLSLSEGADADLARFVDLMSPLATSSKLGCIIIQLPPSFGFNAAILEDFLQILPLNVRFAIKFRNLGWMREETWPLLERYRIAYVNVDEPLLPPEVHLTTDFTYFRWHGRGKRVWFDYRYGRDELEPWIPKVADAEKKAERVFGYFNNHYHGYAVENCLQVMEMLGGMDNPQRSAKVQAERYISSRDGKGNNPPSKGNANRRGPLDGFI